MEICPIRSCGLLNFCAYGSTYNVIFMFTAELNAQMDELEALLAATTRNDNNVNATQNGLVAEIDELVALISAPVRNVNATQNGNYHSIFAYEWYDISLQHYGICLLYNLEWYNVILRFTAELVAEIDELEALLAAPVRNNSSAQNGIY